MKKSQPKHLEFPKAIKSFLGYLEGTQKAAHTIKNYKLDVQAFHSFLSENNGKKAIKCENLSERELELYHEHLKAQGLKTNTRRRKLLTAQRFVRYLSQRNQLSVELPTKLPAPQKIERIPFTVSRDELISAIRKLPDETVLDRRNRAMLWVLAETGCQVSELSQLRFEHWELSGSRSSVTVPGKASRTLAVSSELGEEIKRLDKEAGEKKWIFLGFNKHGPLGAPITSRGVELLVRHYAHRIDIPKLTPRTFRHSAVVAWFKEGIRQDEIQKRLGLKTAYAFRSYGPLLAGLKPAAGEPSPV